MSGEAEALLGPRLSLDFGGKVHEFLLFYFTLSPNILLHFSPYLFYFLKFSKLYRTPFDFFFFIFPYKTFFLRQNVMSFQD